MTHNATAYKEWTESFTQQGLCYRCTEHRPTVPGELYCVECKTKYNKRTRQLRKQNPQHYLWKKAKDRAKRQGVPFNIKPEDIVIPEICPVLGIPLEPADGYPTDNSPSLDKIVPELGYVRGNIAVISRRANHLKGNGSLGEMRAIVRYMEENLK